MSQELLRYIDSICRDKNIDRETYVADLEAAMATAIRKQHSEESEAIVKIDLLTGAISATLDGTPMPMQALGRIAAQTAKQVILQKTRERERNSLFDDFSERRGLIMTGAVTRNENGNLIINLGKTDGFLPRSEQIPGETHQIGERIRVLILEVRELPNQVKIILSRSHPEFILRLFEQEVPEVAEKVIEIKALAREAGYRTKVAVASIDSKVDAVGACVGVRGSRIKNIVDELGGEKIDIVRWNESSQIFIQNALRPAEVQEIALCFELDKATVVVAEDQLSLAIGKRGQNVRLASRLTGWDVNIVVPTEYNRQLELMEKCLKAVEGVDDVLIDKLIAMGLVSVNDIDKIGPEPLVQELTLDSAVAERLVEAAGEEAIRLEEEKEELDKQKAAAKAAGLPWPPPTPESEAAAAAAAAAAAEAASGATGDLDATTSSVGFAGLAGGEASDGLSALDRLSMPIAVATEMPASAAEPATDSAATDESTGSAEPAVS